MRGVDYFKNNVDTANHKEITYTELMQLAYGDITMKQFTKSDLKEGMVVKLRGGSLYSEVCGGFHLVLGNCYINQESHLRAKYYSEDLTNIYSSSGDFDIMEVFTIVSAYSLDFTQMKLKSIWKRPEQTQQQKQLAELQAAQDELLLKAKEISDKIAALRQGN